MKDHQQVSRRISSTVEELRDSNVPETNEFLIFKNEDFLTVLYIDKMSNNVGAVNWLLNTQVWRALVSCVKI
jgi:hypothetical protein